MQDFLEELWSCIKDKEDDKQDSYFSMLGGVHLVLGIISTIVISIITPLHFWGFLTAFIAVALFMIWYAAPKGKLSISYFFAMSFFSLAWVIYLPLLLVTVILCSPIIIYAYKNGGFDDED